MKSGNNNRTQMLRNVCQTNFLDYIYGLKILKIIFVGDDQKLTTDEF